MTPLEPTALFTPCRDDDLSFETTAALEPQQAFPGQDRAVEAIEFGIGIRHEGYDLFTVGAPGSGRHSLVQTFLKRQAARSVNDSDWCYLYNLVQPHRFDGSAPSARALTTCDRLSERLDTRLVVLVPGPAGGDRAQKAQLLADATARVTDLGHRAIVRSVASAVKAVARAIQAENPALCVVACQPESAELGHRLADQLRVSVFLVK